MKKYLAIGHWKETPDATISVAMKCSSVKNFRENLLGNEFVPYVIISENKLNILENTDNLFEEVTKMTTNYRKWNLICDYIEQCLDIMRDKMSACE